MYVAYGEPFTATLIAPGGWTSGVGARVEVPVTRAIVSYWKPGIAGAGSVWSVTMDPIPAMSAAEVPGYGVSPAIAAALESGDFQLVWMDDVDPPSYEIFVPVTAVQPGDWRLGPDGSGEGGGAAAWPEPDLDQVTPSADDVAALVRTRTTKGGGTDVGTFNETTVPTADEVDGLVGQAVSFVLAQLRPTFPASYYDEVKHAVTLYAAILVEASYHREQLAEGSVGLYRAQFTDVLAGIQAGIDLELQQWSLSSGGLLA